MISAAAALVLAFLTTTLFTPVVRTLALRKGVVDKPGGRRVHEHVTPRLGGMAVMLGFFLPLGVFATIQTQTMRGFLAQQNLVVGLVVGSLVVGLVGSVDDVRSLGPWAKLGAQTVAASIAYGFGYRIGALNLPLIGELDMGILAVPVTVFWFLAITNAINLIDGLDGLAAGIALFATIANAAVAYLAGSDTVVLLSTSLGGALLGFLRYNFNPASIFLGDSGSMFLGFVLAATSISGAATKSSTAVAILAPIIALGVPILDTMLAMVRRALARQSIFAADRGHIHHKLLDLGLTHRRVVLTLYGLSVALAVAAVAIAFGRSLYVGFAIVLVSGTVFAVLRSVGMGPFLPGLPGNNSREAWFGALQERLRASLLELAAARDEAGVRASLATLNTQGLIAELLAGDFERLDAQDGSLVFDVGTGPRRRALRVTVRSAAFKSGDAALDAAFRPLAQACSEALERGTGRVSTGARLVVATPASGTED